jgi:hypothetical protein
MVKSRKMGWVGLVTRMGGKRNTYRLLVEKLERMRPLGSPRYKWVDNRKMDI